MELSEKITYLRKRKGWSQEQLAGKLEVSRQAVYKWEAGISQPEIDKLKRISKLFDISFNELLDDELDITITYDASQGDTTADKGQDANEGATADTVAEPILINEVNEATNNVPDESGAVADEPCQVDEPCDKVQEALGCDKIENNEADHKEKELQAENNSSDVKGGKRALLMGIIVSILLTLVLSSVSIWLITYYLSSMELGPETGTSNSQASSTLDTQGSEGADKSDSTTDKSDTEPGGNGSTTDSETDKSQGDNQNPDETINTYYTVRFVVDGAPSIGDIKIKEGGFATAPTLEREGYILLGFVDMDTYEEWSFTENAVTKDITLYAVWMKDNLITVTFDKNDGSGVTESVRVDPRDELILDDLFTGTEKTALGWATTPGGGAKYEVYEKVSFDQSITLYAVWAPKNTVSITFDTNNGSLEKYKVFVTKGNTYTVTTTYDEKGLIGWSKTADGEINYGIGQTVKVNESITLYGIWSDEDGLYFVSNGDGTCALQKYTGGGTTLLIPEYYKGERVTEIKDFAFSNVSVYNDTLKTLQLSSGITVIGENTLYGLRGLERLVIPSSVNSISTKAFLTFGSICEFWVDDANPKYCHIEGALFNKEKTNLIKYPTGSYAEAYRVPDGTNIIEENAFFGCIYLTEVYFPDSVGVVRKSAFEFCIELVTVDFGASLNYVEARAFYDCHSLKRISFEHDIIDIGNSAFYNCRSLTYVEFLGNVNVISYRSFGNCTELVTFKIYGQVTSRVDDNAFEGSNKFLGIEFR